MIWEPCLHLESFSFSSPQGPQQPGASELFAESWGAWAASWKVQEGRQATWWGQYDDYMRRSQWIWNFHLVNSQRSEQVEDCFLHQDEELWFNDEEDFDEEGSGPVLGPGGLGEPTKASCTSVSTTSPQVPTIASRWCWSWASKCDWQWLELNISQAAVAATAALPCQEKVEAPSIVKVLYQPCYDPFSSISCRWWTEN